MNVPFSVGHLLGNQDVHHYLNVSWREVSHSFPTAVLCNMDLQHLFPLSSILRVMKSRRWEGQAPHMSRHRENTSVSLQVMTTVSAALHRLSCKSLAPVQCTDQTRNVACAASMTWSVHPCRSVATVVMVENIVANL